MQTRSAEEGSQQAVSVPHLQVEVGAATHVGMVRETNEDAFAVCRGGRYLERLESNLPESLFPPRTEATGYVMIVADGMGGMAAGEVASHTAVATMIQLILNAPKWALQLDDPVTRGAEIEQMWERGRGYLNAVHDAIRRQAADNPALQGMGTTLTTAYVVHHDLFVLHVGDSRAYLNRAGELIRITRDHTLAQAYADMGIIPEAEIKSHRLSHVLTQAVGGPDEELQVDLHGLRVIEGDRVLLCTDGLTNLFDEAEMAALLAKSPNSQVACQALIQAALERGAPDNVTAVVASLISAEPTKERGGR